jgi:hypothetical protein
VDEQSPGFVPAAGCTKLVLGTVSERPKDHVSKTCVGVNSTVGSNPTGTARKEPRESLLYRDSGALVFSPSCAAGSKPWKTPKFLVRSNCSRSAPSSARTSTSCSTTAASSPQRSARPSPSGSCCRAPSTASGRLGSASCLNRCSPGILDELCFPTTTCRPRFPLDDLRTQDSETLLRKRGRRCHGLSRGGCLRRSGRRGRTGRPPRRGRGRGRGRGARRRVRPSAARRPRPTSLRQHGSCPRP